MIRMPKSQGLKDVLTDESQTPHGGAMIQTTGYRADEML
jgi:hypothetical protein